MQRVTNKRKKKQQASINIVSYIVGIILTVIFVSCWLYILRSLGEYIEKESVDNSLKYAYIEYLVLN